MLIDFLDKALPRGTGNSKDRGAFLRLFLLFCLYLISPLVLFQITSEKNILCTFANKPCNSLFSFP